MEVFVPQFGEHLYTLAATGIKEKEYMFGSRARARAKMYEIIDKKGLHVIEKYEDNHFKTYVCEGGIKFYINRI